MPSVQSVEARILEVEGFEAHFYRNGRNVRSDATVQVPEYPYVKGARDNWTVMEWIAGRWNPIYSGWDVEVRSPSGMPITSRQTILRTVRSR